MGSALGPCTANGGAVLIDLVLPCTTNQGTLIHCTLPRHLMSIRLTPFTLGTICSGYSWEVADEELLAEQIAAVALGQSRHVERVLAGAQLGPPLNVASAVNAAIGMLTVAGTDPSHRDGWMFQVMSWIAAHRANPDGLIRAPQMQLAQKGFDGLQLRLDHDGQVVAAAVIFEDKATSNPRGTIRDQVWPEFLALESGNRDNLLTAEVVALLQTRPGLDPEPAIQNVIWRAVRHYRLSVTVDATHRGEQARQTLFRGYDTVAVGPVARRRGELFEIPDLRPWMAELAQRAIRFLERIVTVNV